MTNAGGTIGDVWAVNERGNKMATFSSILFASPCLGPLVGGYIAESVSWRWIYWVLLIFSGVCWLVSFAFLPET
jgi:MFS family permease